MRPLATRILTLLALAVLLPQLAAQAPGDYPRLTLTDVDGNQTPPPGGPFDNTGEFFARAGSAVTLDLSYEALGQPNPNVMWGLLLSTQQTNFPQTITPPPLFTQPPFQFLFGPPLDAFGDSSLVLTMPAGLFDAEAYVQAMTFDVTSIPQQQLSNGVHVIATPPRFNVAVSYMRFVPGFNNQGIDAAGAADIDGDTLNTHPPLGNTMAPQTEAIDFGLPSGFRLLPISPNRADPGPVNTFVRPITALTSNLSNNPNLDIFPVEDATLFPPQGQIYVQQAGEIPWADKTNNDQNLPNIEVVRYTGKTVEPGTGRHLFTGCQRVQLGSTGTGSGHPHQLGEMVLGDFTYGTSASARTRSQVCLDATNQETPHVVIPEFTFQEPEGGQVSMDLDLYLYEIVATRQQGFMVHDRLSGEWRLLGGTQIDANPKRFWDPMVAISPDRRSFIACQRVGNGVFGWDNLPDEVYAIRLDGLDWPASGQETWEIEYFLFDDPQDNDDTFVRSREVQMDSVAVVGPDSDNLVAYIGFDFKWRQSTTGNQLVGGQSQEGFWLREEVRVADYTECALVGPGSTNLPPVMPRPMITLDMPPVGTGDPVSRFDPIPFVPPPYDRMFLVGGFGDQNEDLFVFRGFNVLPDGEVSKIVQNLTGFAVAGGLGAEEGALHVLDAGGHGQGRRVALSPSGEKIAFLRSRNNNRGDFIHVAATDGSDFSGVDAVFENPTNGNFQGAGAYLNDHAVYGLTWAGEDDLVFVMGRNARTDPLGQGNETFKAQMDVFRYQISTNTMTNLSFTSNGAEDFSDLGRIRPAGYFGSDDGRFVYIVRDGEVSSGNTVLPPDTDVMNVLGVNLETFAIVEVSGDEFGNAALVGNLDLPEEECLSPVETLASMNFAEGSEAQAGMLYFTAHGAADPGGADRLLAFDTNAPFVGIELVTDAPDGTHMSSVVPNPYSSSVVYARTAGSDPFAADEHPFMVDLDNFLFQRDLTPTFFSGGQAIGRVMDGSLHFIPPTEGAGDALVFSAGVNVLNGSFGQAVNAATVYYPLVNLSDPAAEPLPLLLPVLDTNNLGVGHRIFVVSATKSAVE